MTKSKLYPVIVVDAGISQPHPDATPVRKSASDYMWEDLGDDVMTTGRPNCWLWRNETFEARAFPDRVFRVSLDAADRCETSIVKERPIISPAYYNDDSYTETATRAARMFAKTTRSFAPREAYWASWDVLRNLLTPFLSEQGAGHPLYRMSDLAFCRHKEVLALRASCDPDDAVQPFFTVGIEDQTAHDRIQMVSEIKGGAFHARLNTYLAANSWQHHYELMPPVIV